MAAVDRLLGLVERVESSLGLLLALILAPLALEAVHYSLVLLAWGVPGWARGLGDLYPRVLAASLAWGPLRPLVGGGVAWVAAWLMGVRGAGFRWSVSLAAVAQPLTSIALLAVTPAALSMGSKLSCIWACCLASMTVYALVVAAGFYGVSSRREPRRVALLRSAAAASAAVVLLYLTPLQASLLQCQVYRLLLTAG